MSDYVHPYIPNSVNNVKKEMMKEVGINNIEDFYTDIPDKFILKKPLNLPIGLSEFEIKKQIESLLLKNIVFDNIPVFLGAGCWQTYIPAVVKEIIQRSELLTSYTPYQPEISQGILQILFEYQSLISEIIHMPVVNSSMYDWASALGEAARMATRFTKRNEILVPKIIHPDREATLYTYSECTGITIKKIDYTDSTGQLCLDDLKRKISSKTAAVYIENPSYLGLIETQIEDIEKEIHLNNSLFIVGVDPTSLGILRPPGEYGADIVIGEAQPFGNPMNFGGPLLGIFACKDNLRLIRQMPGRIIGLSSTKKGAKPCFCMALQTREQHIRREKATSNICTNETMCAVASAVYLALLGPQGLKKLSEKIMYNSNYAIYLIKEIDNINAPIFNSPHFREFTINFDKTNLSVETVNKKLLKYGIHGGKDISKEFPKLGETALFSFSEIHTKNQIESLVKILTKISTYR